MSRPQSPAGHGLDFGILLNVAFGTFKDALHDHLEQAGFADLGASFGYILRTLEPGAEGMSLKDLAAALNVTPQGTLKIIDDMVAKGYVSRATDARDTRIKRLRVAPRGRALLREARKFHQQFERMLSEKLGAKAVAGTRRVLESLTESDSVGASIRMQLI